MHDAGTAETGSTTTRAAAPGGATADGPRPGLALLVLAAAQLMVLLDATIVNVALPHIQRALGFSGAGLEWVVNAYALTFGGLLLLGGRAGDLLGRRKMCIAGGAIGLIGGGLLTTYASWRWVLLVNVPIGAAVALAAPRVLAETPRRRGRFDLPGALTGTAGITALVYGLISAATSPNGVSHWGDAKVVASLVVAVLLIATFVIIETRSPQPLLPLRLLRDR